MGCGNSKNKVTSAATPRPPTTKPPTSGTRKSRRPTSKTIKVKTADQDTNSDLEGDNIEIPPPTRKTRRRDRAMGSTDSLDSSVSGADGGRGWSASSKFSTHSGDSGLGGDPQLPGHIITEESAPERVAEVEQHFNDPQGLDLSITGSTVPQRYSAKDKDRLDEQRVMASLREEGLIQRPMSRAAMGMSFEIVAADDKQRGAAGYMFGPEVTDGQGRRPARLEKLEKRRKKKKRAKTQEEIQAKLERAEQRRKDAEQERLSKIASLNKSDVLSALDSFANSQKEKEEKVETKMDQATENREKRLNELRDKLRAQQEHAEKVRRRRKQAPSESPRLATPVPKITEDTVVAARRGVNSAENTPVGLGGH